jgi:hypothetical protein
MTTGTTVIGVRVIPLTPDSADQAEMVPLAQPRTPHRESPTVFLGPNLLTWLMLALGGAMAAGNITALVRPRTEAKEGELERPPLTRSLVMAAVGMVVAGWALASLIAG